MSLIIENAPVAANAEVSAEPPVTVTKLDTPVPMSFPAMLRNAGLSNRFAHLHQDVAGEAYRAPPPAKKRSRDDREGKRWIRRKENARFTGNPHIVFATKRDYAVELPATRRTFPEPLPNYLARTTPVPTVPVPDRDPISANAGRFSLSLKGMRRDLRRHGSKSEYLVRVIEDVIVDWLTQGGVMLSPDSIDASQFNLPGTVIGDIESIREVSRTPLQLVWSIADDAFTRYVVHCCARYHEIVSFSKEVDGNRLTYLLRPNVTRPDHTVVTTAGLDTPPTTDLSELSSHDFEVDTDHSGADSEPEPTAYPTRQPALESITEAQDISVPPSPIPNPSPSHTIDEAEWSDLGAMDDSASEAGSVVDNSVSESFSHLALRDDTERAPISASRLNARQRSFRSRASVWDRSGSSPSRSPARRHPPRRKAVRTEARLKVTVTKPQTLYDYLYK